MDKIFRNRIRTVPLLFICSIVFLLGTSVCFAEECKSLKGDKEQKGMPFKKAKDGIFKELNLTKEQEAKLGEYRKQNMPEKKKSMEGLRDSRKKLMEELGKTTSDQNEINRLSSEVKRHEATLLDLHVKSILQMKEVLTPEQYQKFGDRIKEQRKKHQEHRSELMKKFKKDHKEPAEESERE